MPIENNGTPTKEELAAKMKSLAQQYQTVRTDKVAQLKGQKTAMPAPSTENAAPTKEQGSLQQGAKQQAAPMKSAAPVVKEQATEIDKKVMGKIANYSKFVAAASAKYGVPTSQINAIIAVESKGNETADSGAASGLMQVTEDTWGDTCKNFPELKKYSDFGKYRYNPEINIMVGAATLVLKAKTFGLKPDHPKFGEIAVTAYNGGEGTVKMAMKNAQAAGKNPATDYLEPEFLKPAIEHYKIYSCYMPGHKGAKSNKSKTVREAINLKYKEITGYAPQVKHYLAIQGDATSQEAPTSGDSTTTNGSTTAPNQSTPKSETIDKDGNPTAAPKGDGKTLSAPVGENCPNNPDDVTLVQTLLNKQGFKIGIDGKFGDETAKAIADFQIKANLAVKDGVVDPNKNTWKALNGAAISKPSKDSTSDKDTTPSETHDAPKGDGKTLSAPVGENCPNNPDDVTLVQTLLNKQGFKIGIDGKFGDETAKAITDFQHKAGLAVQDGVIEPNKNAWKALNGAAISKPSKDSTSDKDNHHEETPQGNYYTHPNYANVKLILDSGTPTRHPLNATADKLLRSLLAKAGIMQAHVSSTLRTFADQAKAMFDNKRGKHDISYANKDAMKALDQYFAKNDQAGFAAWIEKNAPNLSNHLSGRAIDVTKINHSAFHKVLNEHLAGYSKHIDERPKGLDVTHVEFTFRVV